MMNLPAAAPAALPPGADATLPGLPPPAAADTAGELLLDLAAAAVPAPFAALLDALQLPTAPADEQAGEEDAGAPAADSQANAAQALATMLPAMDALPLAALSAPTPGATPDSVAAVAAALTAPAAAPTAPTASAPAASVTPAPLPLDSAALRNIDSAAAPQRPANTQSMPVSTSPAREDSQPAPAAPQAPAEAAALQLGARATLLAASLRPATPAPAPAPVSRPQTVSADALAGNAAASANAMPADSTAAPVLAKDSAALLGDSQRTPEAAALPGFRSVLANHLAAPDALQLSGNAEQWQQPLRAALGDRLQLQLQRNEQQAVIRLEPPNLGSVEIAIRHSAGNLQVNLSASHGEVLRQLVAIGDAVRADLGQRQYNEVAVTVSASGQRSLAEGGGQGRQQQAQQQRQPGRALDDGAPATTFAMMSERE